jgi:hypothetical protein
MNDPGNCIRPECQKFLSELEELKLEAGKPATARAVQTELPEMAKQHALRCEGCAVALEDFATTREALLEMKALSEPGPWFVTRVMAAIKSAENDIEERKDGVWISVRRLAPRLAAFAALLLVLGGTWAMELRRRETAAQRPELRQVEGLFESAPSSPLNDDIVASASEDARP